MGRFLSGAFPRVPDDCRQRKRRLLIGMCGSADWASALSRYLPERDEIWFTSQCNGFRILRFTRPMEELLELC